MRIRYRLRQLWQALDAKPAPKDQELVRKILSPQLAALFFRMQPSEQVHSLIVLRKLIAQAESDPDLLVAALLHDVGKIRIPLHLWERGWVVLLKAAAPGLVEMWGNQATQVNGKLVWWKRSLQVAVQHPAWGAELVRQAGASAKVQELIRHHQQRPRVDLEELDIQLLSKLQAVDDFS
jgi:putative nucleotidyltransferase with HDIG domain